MRTATIAVMGTVASLACPENVPAAAFAAAAEAAFAVLRRADAVFSPFRPGSVVSRIRDGRMTPAQACDAPPDGPAVAAVLALCHQLHIESDGAFDAWAVGDPPGFDPCGAVKGWAIGQASAALAGAGVPRHALNVGGDVRVRGGDPPWRIGVADPHRPGRVLAVVRLADGAVATSGGWERGPHVWDPRSGAPAARLALATVIGEDVAMADGYATAAIALGADAHAWLRRLAARTGYQALTVDRDTGVWWTAGLPEVVPALRARPAAAVPAGGRTGRATPGS